MDENGDRDDERFKKIIMEMISEAMKNGKFPGEGNFSITIAGGNLPIDIIPPDNEGTDLGEYQEVVKDVRPHTEIQRVGDNVIVSADLPGAKKEETAVSVEGDLMIITSLAEKTRYSTRIKIPLIRKETMTYSLKNGLLEVSAVEL